MLAVWGLGKMPVASDITADRYPRATHLRSQVTIAIAAWLSQVTECYNHVVYADIEGNSMLV